MDENEIVSDTAEEIAETKTAQAESAVPGAEISHELKSEEQAHESEGETAKEKKPLPPVRKDRFFISALVLTLVGGVSAVLFIGYVIYLTVTDIEYISWGLLNVVGYLSNLMLLTVIAGLTLFGIFAVERKSGDIEAMAMPILSLAMATGCALSILCFMCVTNILLVFLCLVSFILALSFGIVALTVFRKQIGKAGIGIAIVGIAVSCAVLIAGVFTVASALTYM